MNKVFCLMGPTASGKTDIALQLASRFPIEIISVDSAMIYRGMDIGTAKPGLAELAIAPHHLIDILNPDQSYSTAAFCKDVQRISADIYQRGKYPLLVGGTMMYFQSLQKGLSELPAADEKVRADLQETVTQFGWDHIYARLIDCDPTTAARLHRHDTQRVLRALEVFILTGKPLSQLCMEQKSCMDAHFHNIALFPENRRWLHDRIAARFDVMLAQGLIEETKRLLESWDLNNLHPSMRTVGYRQVLAFLSGEYDLQQLREKGIVATRQLAKRQLTWLRSFDNTWRVDPGNQEYEKEIMQWFANLLD